MLNLKNKGIKMTASIKSKRTENYHHDLFEEHKAYLHWLTMDVLDKFWENREAFNDGDNEYTIAQKQILMYSSINWGCLNETGIKSLHEVITGNKWTLEELKVSKKKLSDIFEEKEVQTYWDNHNHMGEASQEDKNQTWDKTFSILYQFFKQKNTNGVPIFELLSEPEVDEEYKNIYKSWMEADGTTIHKAMDILSKCSWTEEQRREMSKLLNVKIIH